MEALIIKIKILFPGLIGAFLAAITGDERDVRTRVIGFIFGFCSAVYFTDTIIGYFTLDPHTYSAPIGFSLGYFGMSIAEAGMKALKEIDIAGIIKGWFQK